MDIMKTYFLAAFLALGATTASAATIVNGGFASGTNPGVFTTVNTGGTAIDGWAVDGSVDYIGTYWASSDGDGRSVDLGGNADGAVSQLITDLIVGMKYAVTFDLSGNTDGAPTVKTTRVSVDNAFADFLSSSATTIPGITWTSYVFNFIADSTSTTLKFASTSGTAYGAALDNVAISEISAVPLPATAPLALAGLGAMVALRRRRKAA
jgi:choice-of-anchor C domain-containing protein